MTTADPVAPANSVATADPVVAPDLAAAFCKDLVEQIRAEDSYGRLDALSEVQLLGPFLIAAQSDGDLALPCVADPAAVSRLGVFFRAVSAGVERGTGLSTNCALDIDGEGFGRAVVFVGRLVVLCEALRNTNAFGFSTVGRLADYGAALVQAAVVAAETYPEVAHVQP